MKKFNRKNTWKWFLENRFYIINEVEAGVFFLHHKFQQKAILRRLRYLYNNATNEEVEFYKIDWLASDVFRAMDGRPY